VILTHHHLDHGRNAGLFPDVPIIDGWATWTGVNFTSAPPLLPAGVHIEKTPGHTHDSLTIVIEADDGIVVVCGDLLWWQDDTSQTFMRRT
jgi:glyoxylase-like metal-dependent hydrolase (beta-lactamase superfamily II)